MTQNILMNMAINVYEYGRGGKCVYMFRYTYARIREMKMQMEKKFRQIRRVMRTSVSFFLSLFSIGPVCCFVLLN